MYGFFISCLRTYVKNYHGDEKWQTICQNLSEDEEPGCNDQQIYDDEVLMETVSAASNILGIPETEILLKSGEAFIANIYKSGYKNVLDNLGGTFQEFLNGLDYVHEHLSHRFPGMRAPSFTTLPCTNPSQFYTYYYSERVGLAHMAIGMIQEAARLFFGLEVVATIVRGSLQSSPNKTTYLVECKSGDLNLLKQQGSSEEDEPYICDSIDDTDLESIIDPSTFCQAFPFHMILDENLVILQAGSSLKRMFPTLEIGETNFNDAFTIMRPQIQAAFRNIIARTNTIFLAVSSEGDRKAQSEDSSSDRQSTASESDGNESLSSMDNDGTSLRLKGQMIHLEESSCLLFLCSPRILSLDGLNERGMYLSDIPIHDATRDLILLSEQQSAENSLTKRLEVVTDKLQKTSRDLEYEKRLADKLLYSILPPSVANDLRAKRQVVAKKYELVTVMFSGIVDFSGFCNDSKEPMEIVHLLNQIYTQFDEVTESNPDAYKVETVGDKYMAVSGLPVAHARHAHTIADLALDMTDIAKKIRLRDRQMQITIGVHSGEVVAGVVGKKLPRYCLFGNTVNLTSRCESTGEMGKINVTEDTHRCLMIAPSATWTFQQRGPVAMKGRSKPMTCYLLSR